MEDQTTFNIPSNPIQCQKLISLITVDWLNHKHNWAFMGQCLYNVLDDDGLELFVRYSPQQFEDQANAVWSSYQKTRHGLSALRTIARKLNKEKFNLWIDECVMAAAIGAVGECAAMTEIADIAKFKFGDYFVCSNVGSQTWWQHNGRWQQLSHGHSLREKFSRELCPIFVRVRTGITELGDEDNVKAMYKKCVDIIKGLKDPGFKGVLMRECADKFYIEDFEAQCDENHDILCVKNGIMVFNQKEVVRDPTGETDDIIRDVKPYLRDSYPEDLVTLQMEVPYDPTLSWEHPDVMFIMEFFKKVLYKPDLIDFSLKHKASCLTGKNKNKFLVMNIGKTAHNAKSTCATLDRVTFGKYSGKLPLSVITGKPLAAGAADPAIACTKGTRLQQLDEVNKTMQINPTNLKTFTGNDEVWARKLYSNGSTFLPQFTMIMYANEAPDAKNCASDNGVHERNVWVPHDSRFTTTAPSSVEEQWRLRVFKADPHIDVELKKRAYAYFWILVQYYTKYTEEGLTLPDEVAAANARYRLANDIYSQFVSSRMEKTDRHADYVSVFDIYTVYKLWFAEAYPQSKITDRESFASELERLLGKPESDEKRYHGYKMKSEVKTFNRQ